MGYDPKSEITCLNNLMNVDGKEFMVTHPKDYLKKLLKQYQSPKDSRVANIYWADW